MLQKKTIKKKKSKTLPAKNSVTVKVKTVKTINVKKKFRSKFEATTALYLDRINVPYKYESLNLFYVKTHSYIVDFELPNGIIVETKGYFDAEDRAKHLEIKKMHPDRDIRFLFMADNKIHKLSETRYTDWCKRHGFPCAVSKEGIIPKEWLLEKPKNV